VAALSGRQSPCLWSGQRVDATSAGLGADGSFTTATAMPKSASVIAIQASRFTNNSAASRADMPTRTPHARASSFAALMVPSS
jgi:hypothetical protein